MFFVTLAPLCSDSSTFEGLGAQVGATWGTKSHPRVVRTAKMTSNRAAGGVRAAKVGPVRLDCLGIGVHSAENPPESKKTGPKTI